MKTKTTTLIFILLVFSTICRAQAESNLIIRKDSLRIGVENSGSVFSLLYEITNRSNSTYYLWIEREVHSTNREKIMDYFAKSRGGWHLAGMAIDRNAIWLGRSIYGTFVKKIKPQETFTIQILSEEEFSDCKKEQIFDYLDAHVVIVSEDTLRQYVRTLDSFNPVFFYRHSFITIPINMLDFSATNMQNR